MEPSACGTNTTLTLLLCSGRQQMGSISVRYLSVVAECLEREGQNKISLSLPCSPIICHIMLERSPGTSVSNTVKIVLWPTSMIKSLVDQYRATKVVQLSHHCLQPSAVYSVPPFPQCQMFCFEEASLFLWCSDSVLYEWDIAAGTCLRSLTGHSRPITAVWVSHNNQLE